MTERMTDKCVSNLAENDTRHTGVGKFRIWGIPWGEPPQIGEKTHPGHICTIVLNLTPIGATVADASVTKQPDRKQT